MGSKQAQRPGEVLGTRGSGLPVSTGEFEYSPVSSDGLRDPCAQGQTGEGLVWRDER